MSERKRQRRRAVRLTSEGWERLQAAIVKLWSASGDGGRLTRERQADLLGISVVTLGKIRKGEGVDQSTLILSFENAQEPWLDRYMVSPDSAPVQEQQSHRMRPRWILVFCGLFLGVPLIGLFKRGNGYDKLWYPEYFKYQQAGQAAYHRAEFVEAERNLDAALTIAKDHDDASSIASTLRMQGEVFAARGNLDESIHRYRQAVGIREVMGQRLAVAAILEVMADAEVRLGRLNDAQTHYHIAMDGYAKEGKPGGLAACYRGLGTVEANRGNIPGARAWFHNALSSLEKQPNPDMTCDIQSRLALLLRDEGNLAQAESELLRCLSYWRNRAHPRWIATTEYQLGTVLQRAGRKADAKHLLEKSESVFSKLGDRTNAFECSKLLAVSKVEQ